MLAREILFACVLVVLAAQFPLTSNGELCHPSFCGDIHNISYPFRLTTDPYNCGQNSYELSCEENFTILYLNSQKYKVKAINYNNFTIRLLDSNLQKDNCSSLPHNSLHISNFNRGDLYTAYYYNRKSYKLNKPINIMRCSYRVDSPLFVDAGPCINGSSAYYYATLGHLEASDVRDSCIIELMVMTSSPVKDDKNPSFSEIHDALLYGFELSWFNSECPKCKYGCVIDFANNFVCHDFCITGNKDFYTLFDYGCHDTAKWIRLIGESLLELLLIGIGGYIALKIICCIPFTFTLLIYTRRRRHRSVFDMIEGYLQSQNNLIPIRYSYSEIKKMTGGFKDKLGEGGYGCVYKSKLRSGDYAAIKLLGKSKANGQDFINEVSTIGRIHHVNVVRLIGFCAERSKRALVYEFMANGSLEKYLSSKEENTSMLSLEKKFDIVLGVARGIEYLHRGCDIQILHFDIKPHNILLDENFIPKVSDFGLAKLCPTDNNTVSLTAARGTIGYVAPELINRRIGGISYKADVYSFGMLLMEILDLKRNTIATEENSTQYFPDWVYDRLKKGKDIEMTDCSDDDENKVTKKMTLVGLWCIQMNPLDRPSMTKVVEMLEGGHEILQMPPDSSDFRTPLSPQDPTSSGNSIESLALLSGSLT